MARQKRERGERMEVYVEKDFWTNKPCVKAFGGSVADITNTAIPLGDKVQIIEE